MNYESLLKDLVSADDRFIIMTAENRAAIRNLPEKIGNKFIDTGITEQTMIGMAAGLALRGRIPVTHALASFLTMRAFEFIRTDVGIPALPVKLVGGVAGLLSEANGPTHQAIEDISIMRGIPNVNIFAPADEEDMLIGLKDVLISDKPFYIRYNNLKSALNHSTKFEIGKAETVNYGDDVAILTYGTLLRQSYEAMMILESKGISVRLLNMRTLKPLDEEAVINAAIECSLVVIIEDHFVTGGLFSAAAEILLKNGINANVMSIGLESWFKPALLQDVLKYEQFTGPDIASRIASKHEETSDRIKIKSLI
ncbi:MAG: transketolase [Ignavibacteria bacterium]|nr:transketolase [Ignavibacteria bacterium]